MLEVRPKDQELAEEAFRQRKEPLRWETASHIRLFKRRQSLKHDRNLILCKVLWELNECWSKYKPGREGEGKW